MNTKSRLLTGIVFIGVGVYFSWLALKDFWILIYSLPLILIGLFIIFNKNEDKIDSRKDELGAKNE